MFIESVVIDGFKSYSKRVEIDGFDQSFNAITGLNGTGKSNILDAICFVLGVKNLDKVRAKNLQELVYKQGQAGINKATVTIKFNNEDGRCPEGPWKDKKKIMVTRQVQVGGKDKYMINGVNAVPSRVHDMFQSFKLNVNNPHFLVMQGRITKVLNMKPMEMLKMLEEAIGTQMYQEKRGRALKNMEKKENDLADIEQLLEAEIKPQLQEMKQELEDYKAYQRAVSEVDTLAPLIRAYNYYRCLCAHNTLLGRVAEAAEAEEQLEVDAKDTESSIEAADRDIKEAKKQLEQMGSAKLKAADKRVQDLAMKLAEVRGEQEALSDSVKIKRQEKQDYQKQLDDLSEEIFSAAIKELQKAVNESQLAASAADAEFEAAKCHLAGAERGDGRDVNNLTMPERVQQAEDDVKKHRKEAERLEAAIRHLSKEFKKASDDATTKRGADAKLMDQIDAKKAAVERAEAAVAASGFDPAALTQLQQQRAAKITEVQNCQARKQQIMQHVGHVLGFSYQNPSPNFDRRQVRGPIARLATPKNPEHVTALEVAAGGKLAHIAVDTDRVGAELLKRGKLQKRTTFVPLNSTKSRAIAPDRCAAARQATNGRATPALDLLRYSADLKVAIQYAYGSAFVCEDQDAAKTVCFSKNIATRGISLQGDDFNPGGTLTGGSRRQQQSTLAKVQEFETIDNELHKLQNELEEIETQLQAAQQQLAQHNQAVSQLEIARHALQCIEQEAASSASHKAQQNAEDLEAQLNEQKQQHGVALEKAKAAEASSKELKKTMALLEKDKGAVVKEAQAKLQDAKKAQEAAQKARQEREQLLQDKMAERDAAVDQRAETREQLEEADSEEKSATDQLEKVLATYKTIDDQLHTAQTEKDTLEKDRAECSSGIQALEDEKAKSQKTLKMIGKEKEKLKKQKEKLENEERKYKDELKGMEKDYPSLVDAKDELGVEGGKYDFEALDIHKKEAAYQKAKRDKDEKECTVNKQVMTKAEQLQKEYDELTDKQSTVIKDRDALKQVIEELDSMRKKTLESTWMKVTGMFSDIFKTLLPGTEACLQPSGGPNGDFLEGLEVRVAFGGVWKESLSELSGGQRSLLSLSLILALLKLQPAPVYILDEVDAALDPSHTQNIGKLIKEQFSQAQFLIVSLKDGMFNNANVLFRTQFVDGSSTVRATRNGGAGGKRGAANQPPRKAGRLGSANDQENYVAT